MTDTHTGGEAVALALEALGVTHVFTVPSAHNLTILKAIHRRGRVEVIGCRHEQGVVHAADGYARTTGRLGVAIVSGGPGTANTMGGLYEAHHASSPVLLLTSQVDTRYLGRGFGYVHEADQQATMLRTACKDVRLTERVDEVAETVVAAGLLALRGRPRPVAVEVPIDVADAEGPAVDTAALAATVERAPAPAAPVDAAVAAAVAVLQEARRPLIWAGGGVIHADASAELTALAERWQAPVLTSREGRGSIDDDHELALGAVATTAPMREFIADCDVLLAVGSHFQQYPTGQWTLPFPARIVQLDVDPTMIGRSFDVEAALVADARIGLATLLDALPEPANPAERTAHLERGRAATEATRAEYAAKAGPDQLAICAAIDARPVDVAVVRDPTTPATVWGESIMRIRRPRTSVRATSSAIGPALPLGIGAAVGTGRPVVVLHGDGGFMLSVGELATAVQAKTTVVICLFNDSGYQMLRNIEARIGDGSLHDTELATPRFAELAESFGARGVRVASAEEFSDAFTTALGTAGPTLIEIDMTALQPMGV